MIVGICFDCLPLGLSAEESKTFSQVDPPDTIYAIEKALQSLGHSTKQLGDLPCLVANPSCLTEVDLVFNSCAGLRGDGHEGHLASFLESYGIPYTFSKPTALMLSQDKHFTKVLASSFQVHTSPWLLVRCNSEIEKAGELSYPLFLKPCSMSDSVGIHKSSLVTNEIELRHKIDEMLTMHDVPVLVEEYLPGTEYTVGVVGSRKSSKVIGALKISQKREDDIPCYTFNNKSHFDGRTHYELMQKGKILDNLSSKAQKIWSALDGRGAGRIDFRENSSGIPCLLEVNCLPGLHPVKSDLVILSEKVGLSYSALIQSILEDTIKTFPKVSQKKEKIHA